MTEHAPGDQFRRVAGAFSDVIAAVKPEDWERPAPCDGWVARDVVRHLVEWVPSVFSRSPIEFTPGPSCSDDPAGAWAALAATLQHALDAPEIAATEFDAGPPGTLTVDVAINMLVVGDVLVHTWDLATAIRRQVRLDQESVSGMLAGLQPIDEMLRSSGHYGPKVTVADDADEQTKLIAFTGRDPGAG